MMSPCQSINTTRKKRKIDIQWWWVMMFSCSRQMKRKKNNISIIVWGMASGGRKKEEGCHACVCDEWKRKPLMAWQKPVMTGDSCEWVVVNHDTAHLPWKPWPCSNSVMFQTFFCLCSVMIWNNGFNVWSVMMISLHVLSRYVDDV